MLTSLHLNQQLAEPPFQLTFILKKKKKAHAHTLAKENAVHTLASRLLTSASSEVRAAFWLRAVERAASLLLSWPSNALALDTTAARSLSFFLALEQQGRAWTRQFVPQTGY